MQCGGVFACKLDSSEIFVCSDGIEMNQKELLNIVQAVNSLLHDSPLTNSGRRILFVEAASTLVRTHRKVLWGISTYHPLSASMLQSQMERVINAVNTIYQGNNDIDLNEKHNRAILYAAIRHLLNNHTTFRISPQILKSFNQIKDIAASTPIAYDMNPSASGEFKASAIPIPQPKDESTTETSQTDSIPSTDPQSLPQDTEIQNSIMATGSTLIGIAQTIIFACEGELLQNCTSDTDVNIQTSGSIESGPFTFTVKYEPIDSLDEIKINTAILKEISTGVYSSENPTQDLTEMKTVVKITNLFAQIPPPFTVLLRTVREDDNNASIFIKILCNHAMEGIIIAVACNGLEILSCNCQTSPGSEYLIVYCPDITEEEDSQLIQINGTVTDSFVAPTEVNVQGKIHDLIVGNINIEPAQGTKYLIGMTQKELFVQRSVWSFPASE